jgi:hypothetical protein
MADDKSTVADNEVAISDEEFDKNQTSSELQFGSVSWEMDIGYRISE